LIFGFEKHATFSEFIFWIPILGIRFSLILSVSENGYGKRTNVEEYRLQSRGGKGVINMKTTPKIGKVTGISLIDAPRSLYRHQ
jgi:DNA gyrase subunit A